MARIGLAPYKINASFTEVSPGVYQGDYDYGKASTTSTTPTATTTSTPSQLTSPQQTQLAAIGSKIATSTPSTSVSTPSTSSVAAATGSAAVKAATLATQMRGINNASDLSTFWSQVQYANQRGEITSSQYNQLKSEYLSLRTTLAQKAANNAAYIKNSVSSATTVSQLQSIKSGLESAYANKSIIKSDYVAIGHSIDDKIALLQQKEKTSTSTSKLQAPAIYNDILDKMNAFYNAKSLSGLQGLITEINSHKANGVLSDYQASSLLNQVQAKITSLKSGDTAIYNQLVQLIQNATTIAALASALTQVNSQHTAGNINDTQLKQLQNLYTAKYKELQTKSKEADDAASQLQRFQSFVSALQQATSLTQLESVKAQIESARSGGLISSSQYAQLLSLYMNMQSQLEKQKQVASRFNEFYAIIQNATSTSALTYLPSQLQSAVSEGTLSTNEYTSLTSLLQQKIAKLQQQEEEEAAPTVEVDLPTATDIYSAPDLQVLSNYESQLNRAVKLGAIEQTQYIILANAISTRRTQLLQEQQAETTSTPAAAAPSQTIVTIAPQSPAPYYQQPTAPTIVQTAPSVITAPSPAPIIYSPPSQVVSPVESGAPAAAPDWSFMTPDEGPPLPRSLGIRWPWYKKPVAA